MVEHKIALLGVRALPLSIYWITQTGRVAGTRPFVGVILTPSPPPPLPPHEALEGQWGMALRNILYAFGLQPFYLFYVFFFFAAAVFFHVLTKGATTWLVVP